MFGARRSEGGEEGFVEMTRLAFGSRLLMHILMRWCFAGNVESAANTNT